MGKTTIEWASHTWNPYTWNCNKVSPGCAHCYAETLATRRGQKFAGAPTMRGDSAWKELRSFPAGSVLFVNSMSDTYHEGATLCMIHSIHNAAAYVRPDVTFLVLTKRPERALALSPMLAWPSNLWIGTSVENDDYLWRLSYLVRIPAAGRFVSAEPLIGSLKFGFETYLYRGLNWVIVGGESGSYRREFVQDWAREIRDMCIRSGTPFLFKQGNGFHPGQNRILDGREWNESPFHLERHDPIVERAKPAMPVQLELF